MKKIITVLTFIIILNISLLAAVYELKPEISVLNSKVYLSDLFIGIYPEFKNIQVTTSARPGYTKTISKNYLQILLKRVTKDDNINIIGNETIKITTKSQKLDLASIKEKMYKIIKSKLNFPKEDISVEFQAPAKLPILPLGNLTTEIRFNKLEDFKGVVIGYIKLYVNNKYFTRMYLRSKVRTWENVLVNITPLKWHETLTSNKVVMKKMETSNITGKLLTKINRDMAIRGIPANTILTTKVVKTMPILKRGSRINIVYKSDFVTLKTKGIARQDGYENEYIKVQNINSKKILSAKVVNASTVIVN